MYDLPRIGQLTAFLFVVCGVARLARFNVQRHAVDGRYFVGLPIPAAAGLIAALVLLQPQRLVERLPSVLVAVGTALVALLMVSTFRYPSFKNLDLRARRSYRTVLVVALGILLLASHPAPGLLSLATLYCVWGPAAYLVSLARRRGDATHDPANASASHGARGPAGS
jgi:CDP-diacylglycerol--serine O-phosphatidyltransferase